jgi:hypothetical protein
MALNKLGARPCRDQHRIKDPACHEFGIYLESIGTISGVVNEIWNQLSENESGDFFLTRTTDSSE